MLRNGTRAIRLAEPSAGLISVDSSLFSALSHYFNVNDNAIPSITNAAKPTISGFLLLACFLGMNGA